MTRKKVFEIMESGSAVVGEAWKGYWSDIPARFLILAGMATLLVATAASAGTVRCSPWQVNGKSYGNDVTVTYDDLGLTWTDGHILNFLKEVDRTPLGRTYVRRGQVLFALNSLRPYVNDPNRFDPKKIVLVEQNPAELSQMAIICGDKK